MINAFYHPGFAADIGQHIMPMRKFAMVAEALKRFDWVRLIEPQPVVEVDLMHVHTPAYINAIRTGEPRELAESQKFPWSPALWPSVLLTNGGCASAAEDALVNGCSAALVSGFHHSHAVRGEGFCTFNGLIVAAEALKAAGRLNRVAILDMDLHYGNGTALLANSRPWITAVSVYGNDYWDNKAYRDVSAKQHVDGPNHRSFALAEGCDRRAMLGVMAEALPALLACGKPDLLLYQAGADPLRDDPYSPLDLNHEDLLERDKAVFRFAKQQQLPIAWVLAGGYTADTRKVVQVHVNTFVACNEIIGVSA